MKTPIKQQIEELAKILVTYADGDDSMPNYLIPDADPLREAAEFLSLTLELLDEHVNWGCCGDSEHCKVQATIKRMEGG